MSRKDSTTVDALSLRVGAKEGQLYYRVRGLYEIVRDIFYNRECDLDIVDAWYLCKGEYAEFGELAEQEDLK